MCKEATSTIQYSIFLSKDERLASLDCIESSPLADGALQLEGDLLGGLCLLSEDGLCLPSETFLLSSISSLSLSHLGDLTFLVLRYLVHLVLLAFATECSLLLGGVDLYPSVMCKAYHLSITIINIK